MIRSLIKGAALAAAFGPLCAPSHASVVMNATRYVLKSNTSDGVMIRGLIPVAPW